MPWVSVFGLDITPVTHEAVLLFLHAIGFFADVDDRPDVDLASVQELHRGPVTGPSIGIRALGFRVRPMLGQHVAIGPNPNDAPARHHARRNAVRCPSMDIEPGLARSLPWVACKGALARVWSAAVRGIDTYLFDVETDIANSEYDFPLKRITGYRDKGV